MFAGDKKEDQVRRKEGGSPSGTYTEEPPLLSPKDSVGICFLWAQWEGRTE